MITVIDSQCGAGKTSAMIDMISKDKLGGYIYITPYLSEVERVKRAIGGKEPENYGKGKLNSFKRLLLQGNNIVSTHALFYTVDTDTVALIESMGYSLVLDEVLNVVEPVWLNQTDIEIIKKNLVNVEDDGLVVWKAGEYDYGRYGDLKYLADRKQLYFCNNTFFVWVFPVDVFNAFKNVYICTYLFDDQIQRYYYDLNNLVYEKVSVREGKIIPYEMQTDNLEKIHILEKHPINNIGDRMGSLSKTWYIDNEKKPLMELLKKNMANYRRNIAKFKGNDVIWTTFKDFKDKLSGKGYAKGYLISNARATNEYIDKHYVMYCINKFMNPYIKSFFVLNDVYIDEDKYALSEMIQFIYRSSIRRGEDIYCYIPSKRMRELLINFIDDHTQNKD